MYKFRQVQVNLFVNNCFLYISKWNCILFSFLWNLNRNCFPSKCNLLFVRINKLICTCIQFQTQYVWMIFYVVGINKCHIISLELIYGIGIVTVPNVIFNVIRINKCHTISFPACYGIVNIPNAIECNL